MSFWILNRFVNPWVRWLLRSPLHPMASRSLILLEYTAKKSGRRHALPVQYVESQDELVVVVGFPEQKRWWRNLRPEASVRVLLRGRSLPAHARVLEGDVEAIVPRLLRYFERFPAAARYHGIVPDEKGNVDRKALLDLAGRAVLVVIRVSPD